VDRGESQVALAVVVAELHGAAPRQSRCAVVEREAEGVEKRRLARAGRPDDRKDVGAGERAVDEAHVELDETREVRPANCEDPHSAPSCSAASISSRKASMTS